MARLKSRDKDAPSGNTGTHISVVLLALAGLVIPGGLILMVLVMIGGAIARRKPPSDALPSIEGGA